ncbi:MAG: hypothetical protein V4731_08215 [Pseudomonadota bacterium]
MATSSLLGGDRAPRQPAGTDVDSLGPSDTTDSGSDARGALDFDELMSDSDAVGTGERASVEPVGRVDRDILPDHVERVPGEGSEDALDLLDDTDPAELDDLASDDDPSVAADGAEDSAE